MDETYLADIVDGIASGDKPIPDLLPVAHLAGRMFTECHGGTYEHYTERNSACQRAGSGMCNLIPSIARNCWIWLEKHHCIPQIPPVSNVPRCLPRDLGIRLTKQEQQKSSYGYDFVQIRKLLPAQVKRRQARLQEHLGERPICSWTVVSF